MRDTLIGYTIITVIVFLIYGLDKWRAKKERWRISEKVLLLLALIGPFGAYIGMRIFHHKTRKAKFEFLVTIFAIVHILIILYIFDII